MTRNIKNRIEIYYDSPLEICEEGTVFLEDMVIKLEGLKDSVEKEVDLISVKTQKVKVEDFITLAFPIL